MRLVVLSTLTEIKGLEVTLGDYVYSADTIKSWDAATQLANGVLEIISADPPPYGKAITGYTLEEQDGYILEVPTLEDDSLAELKTRKLQEIGAARWEQCQSFLYDGVIAPADPALTAVTGFVVAAQIAPPSGTSTWKLAPGEFRQWTVAEIIAYGIAIRNHVQGCFSTEEALSAEVASATIVSALGAIVWPS
jgi:hypothetical protein